MEEYGLVAAFAILFVELRQSHSSSLFELQIYFNCQNSINSTYKPSKTIPPAIRHAILILTIFDMLANLNKQQLPVIKLTSLLQILQKRKGVVEFTIEFCLHLQRNEGRVVGVAAV